MIKLNVEKKSISEINDLISIIIDYGGEMLDSEDKKQLCFELKGIPLNRKAEILKELAKY